MLYEFYKSKLEGRTVPGLFRIFPDASDRNKWESVDEGLKKHVISEAEELLGYRWPRFMATDYMEYYREGSRKSWDKVFKCVFDALTKLTIAECIEGKGRFLDDIANGVFARCEDTSWVHTGHLRNRGSEHIPLYDANYLDLRTCSTGSQLAHVYYLLKPQLDEVSPHICRRIEHEIKYRIIDNYIENDYWWTNLSGDGTINNWNTHCNKNVIRTALIMESDPDRLKTVMEKACRSLDVFLSIHEPDGACDEGPGYWKGAGFSYLTILSFFSEIYSVPVEDFLDDRIKNMGSYIYKVIIKDDYYMSYADGNGRNPMYDVKLYKTGMALKDEALRELAADTFRIHRNRDEYYDYFIYILHDYLEYIMSFDDIKRASASVSSKKYYLRDTVLKDAHIASARQTAGTGRGFFTGIKGGHNDESHNHNDIGVFYLYYDGLPAVIDVGAGMYTIKTFGPDRYDIWTMQSQWHSLPVVNDHQQSPGRDFKSVDFLHDVSGDISKASMEISGAYPDDAGIMSYRRGIELDRSSEKVILDDVLELTEPSDNIIWYLTTAYEPEIHGNKTVSLTTGKATINVEYDLNKFDVYTEKTDTSEDKKLSGSWGDSIFRLCFKCTERTESHKFRLIFNTSGENIDE